MKQLHTAQRDDLSYNLYDAAINDTIKANRDIIRLVNDVNISQFEDQCSTCPEF